MSSKEKILSIVVPLKNEEGNVEKLHQEITNALQRNNLRAEIIFVDDGSTDKTLEKTKNLRPLKTIVFRKNFGQTAALDAGIKASKGEIIITMDGDLQNDPADIPKLLNKLDEGYDVVSGWRKERKDSASKKFASRGADFLRKIFIDDQIHDSGCSLKAYKKECFENVDLYGEMHRFIPGVLKIQGFKIGETVVNHQPRTEGVTKYNYKRVGKSLLDMVSVWFWRKFFNRPLHLFGGIGSVMTLLGIVILVWMFVDRLFFGNPIGNRIWPIVGIFMILMGVQLFISGLLADINVKTYHQAKKETPYNIKEVKQNE
jgi:glycosyltransferase involved in cell wall biosynthesis